MWCSAGIIAKAVCTNGNADHPRRRRFPQPLLQRRGQGLDGHAGFGLPQESNDLFFRKWACFFMSVILQGLTDFSTLSWYGWAGAGHFRNGS